MNDNVILKIKNISKEFSGVAALNDVSLKIKKGEIRAIAGENGAGKSTLMKLITGAYSLSSGEIIFDGVKIQHHSPQQAKRMGIGVIYQELNLMPQLTVAENLFFGEELKRGILLDKKKMLKKSYEMITELGVNIDPRKKVKDLSIAEQQIVEIVKEVSKNIKLLIMDEPTAPLTNSEIQKMYSIIERLRKKEITIIYISHRLEEIFDICDTVTVLRDGMHICTTNTSETNREQLIKNMVGREIGLVFPSRKSIIGDEILVADKIGTEKIHGCSFTLRRGEILGFSGLVGAGRTELARAVFGADKILSGTLDFNGKKVIFNSPRDAITAGIGLITEDRKTQGLLLNKEIDYNITYASLKGISACGFINKSLEKHISENQIKAMNIKISSHKQLTRTLSGGNQQKVVLGKWLATDCDLLIFDEPTRGIDVGAKQEIYQLIRTLSELGKSIIMISSEMIEILGMCDRIIVMKDGTICETLINNNVSEEDILNLAAK